MLAAADRIGEVD